MRTAKVVKAYTDRLTGTVRVPGDSVELTDERAAELSAGGFVELSAQEAAPVGQPVKPDYSAMSYAELKEAAKAAGIPAAGKKAALIAALGAL